eukprot:8659726-Heterocapsa_arctica.AAC.1
MAGKGELPTKLRWILGSGGMFLEKPGKEVHRLIRSGEYWAKSCAKACLRDNRTAILKLMIKLHQYGVATPGGTEALFHGRATVEEVAKTGVMGELAIIDVDL